MATAATEQPWRASLHRGPNDEPADLLHWPQSPAAAQGSPSTVVLFFPGNPGLPGYYTHFLTSLHAHLSKKGPTTIYALGHLNHCPSAAPSSWNGKTAPNLSAQVDHKVAFVDNLHKEGKMKDSRVVLMGHSIGSWVCCEVIKARPHLISQACLLFPTISHMALTPNGRRLAPLFNAFVLTPVAMGTSLLSWIPRRLLDPAVALLAGQTRGSDGARTTASLVASPGTVTAALSMAADEMRMVKQLDTALLKEHGDKLWWYWAEGESDGWVSGSSVTEIEGVLDGAGHSPTQRKRCEDGMKHAFCLRDDHAGLLAQKMAQWIETGASQK